MPEPVGEDAWMALVDEGSRTARDLEQRVEIVELYKRAVSAEPYSLRLWLAYCEWVWSLHTDCQSGDAGWSEEEQQLGQELFALETTLDVWQQGAQAIQFRLQDSHVLWNRWISIELEQLAKHPGQDEIDRIRQLFLDRLQVPHAAWDDTSQLFSTFITKYDEASWEKIMVQSTQLAKHAKELYSQREVHELALQKAVESSNKETQLSKFNEYLEWEIIQSKKKNANPLLCFALYERALVILGTEVSMWEDYADFIGSHIRHSDDQIMISELLPLLQRATKHCPWSGMLWSRYLLRAESEAFAFSDIEQIKHAATSTGQLDRDGMQDVIEVYSTWCEYLRRRAVREGASEEDVDVADVGLSSALESVQEWGERLYGHKIYKGDPAFRLQRCWIRYMTAKGGAKEARSVWLKLIKSHGDSYEFWQRYYAWEMSLYHADPSSVYGRSSPSLATALLKQAVARKTLDWPEKILEIYIEHCQAYEDSSYMETALAVFQRNSKGVAKRRQREAVEAAAAYTVNEVSTAPDEHQHDGPGDQQQELPSETVSPYGASKRKRDLGSEVEVVSSKKLKGDEEDPQLSSYLKRDRENTTILVTNLPKAVTQTKIRQYFKEYGHINNLTLKVESDQSSSTALIEFRSTDDVQSALLRNGKYFNENQIRVEPGTGLTVFVTNFPPTADETFFHKLFHECGEILSIRWPSLKHNTHRRFCYISFNSVVSAAAATKLDGKMLENQYKLFARYSDPGAKKHREGPMNEGREVHVGSLDRAATENDLREVFSKYGEVESVRILTNIGGRSKGVGFVVFLKKEDAIKALALNKTKFMSQILTVEISTASNFKPTATSAISKASSASPVPDIEGDIQMLGSSAGSLETHNSQALHGPSRAEIASRTITLMNVPDTINDARIRRLTEPFGSIVKLVLRPDHQGAIIEFADVAAAGRASLGLENYEINPGRKLRTGGLKDLFQEKDEMRTDRIQIGAAARKSTGFIQPSAPIRRPGGRGGLGTKRGLGFSAMAKNVTPAVLASEVLDGGTEENKGPAKSNADFKAMFLKGSEQ